jgi:hypothetical protein
VGLISFPETPKADFDNSRAVGTSTDGRNFQISGSAKEVLSQIIPMMSEGNTIHFMSNGIFSMHELLEHLLTMTGPAELYITTWAMTENPVRAIKHMIDQGLITKLNCLFDFKIRKNSPKAFQLASNLVAKLHLAHCHAKATVLLNEKHGVTIIGSANYTRNPRIEAGTICFDRDIALFHADWIMQEMTKTQAFESGDPDIDE